MTTTRKKNKSADKGKKKISAPSKHASRPEVSDAVCVIDSVVLTEQLYCCDDEYCCLM